MLLNLGVGQVSYDSSVVGIRLGCQSGAEVGPSVVGLVGPRQICLEVVEEEDEKYVSLP